MENFRSFRDEAVLDLRAVGRSPAGATAWDGRLGTVAAVYGANASGKSTLFNALLSLRTLVTDSYKFGAVQPEPFMMESAHPTRLSATFVAPDGVCYAYGVGLQGGHVVEEWAERYTTARATMLFERDAYGFTYGTALRGTKKSVERTVSENSLFLSAAAAQRYEPLMPLFTWFADELRCYSAGGYRSIYETVFDELGRNPESLARVSEMIREADLGLTGVELTRRPLTETERIVERHRQELSRSLDGRDRDVPEERIEASFTHRTADGHRSFAFEMESDGTKAMLCHAYVIDQALQRGRTVVFDEIDASLHPLLVASVVRLFKNRQTNPQQAQFIFTTHDVSLIDPSSPDGAPITRDEMWVTEKHLDGSSQLIPVAEFKPRADQNLRRRYLTGRYGGIPSHIHLGDARADAPAEALA